MGTLTLDRAIVIHQIQMVLQPYTQSNGVVNIVSIKRSVKRYAHYVCEAVRFSALFAVLATIGIFALFLALITRGR